MTLRSRPFGALPVILQGFEVGPAYRPAPSFSLLEIDLWQTLAIHGNWSVELFGPGFIRLSGDLLSPRSDCFDDRTKLFGIEQATIYDAIIDRMK